MGGGPRRSETQDHHLIWTSADGLHLAPPTVAVDWLDRRGRRATTNGLRFAIGGIHSMGQREDV